jgi:DNA-binding protein HU-beta
MNLAQLVDRLSEETGVTKIEAESMIKHTIHIIKTEVRQGNFVKIIGFGTFKKIQRKQRNGRNPKTGERIVIPASDSVKFVAGAAFKEVIIQ